MSKINLTFKGKKYEIDKSLLAGAITSLETAFDILSGNVSETDSVAVLDEAILDYVVLA